MIELVLCTTIVIVLCFTVIIIYSIKKGHTIQSIDIEFVKLKVQAKLVKKAKRKADATNIDQSNKDLI